MGLNSSTDNSAEDSEAPDASNTIHDDDVIIDHDNPTFNSRLACTTGDTTIQRRAVAGRLKARKNDGLPAEGVMTDSGKMKGVGGAEVLRRSPAPEGLDKLRPHTPLRWRIPRKTPNNSTWRTAQTAPELSFSFGPTHRAVSSSTSESHAYRSTGLLSEQSDCTKQTGLSGNARVSHVRDEVLETERTRRMQDLFQGRAVGDDPGRPSTPLSAWKPAFLKNSRVAQTIEANISSRQSFILPAFISNTSFVQNSSLSDRASFSFPSSSSLLKAHDREMPCVRSFAPISTEGMGHGLCFRLHKAERKNDDGAGKKA
eukprot:GEMP01045388.1.p1 GENE.GEMP01045388.1~~GEMP01045388.1.p1  ORF type:complete len:314 (+),score=52.63 GEMP01045388.1:493-1434(+)